MSPNNQIQADHHKNSLQDVKNSQGFYKWFLEVQSKVSEESIDSIHDDYVLTLMAPSRLSSISHDEDAEVSEDEEELPLGRQRRIEKVKKFLATFSDSDILLELNEDERTESEFAWKFSPLETFSILGAIGFFNSYLKRRNEATEAFEKLLRFTEKYASLEKNGEFKKSYLIGMESVAWDLKNFYAINFGDCGEEILKSNVLEVPVLKEEQCKSVVLAIKNYFLAGFQHPELFLTEQASLADQMIDSEPDPGTSEWHLNRYNIKRSIRLQELLMIGSKKLPIDDEKVDAESAFKLNPKNPWNTLATCTFMTDYLAGNGLSRLTFGDMKFQTHSEIVTFIRDSATDISEVYPTFLRAHFAFAEIFANELPITRQDRDFARSMLEKALSANPLSSKINHKTGLCLMKSRQFSEAKNHIMKSIELDPSNASAHYTLVKLLMRDPTGINKELLDTIFNTNFDSITEALGPENQLAFWKASYFFITGDTDLAVNMWCEVILEFYVTKPELDLEIVLPFKELPNIAYMFFWARNPLTLKNAEAAIRSAIEKEKTRRRVVLNRLLDLVTDAIKT